MTVLALVAACTPALSPTSVYAAAPVAEPVPACVNAAPQAQAKLALHNKHCIPQTPPPPPVPVPAPPPNCSTISSVNIYDGPTGSFTCGSIAGGVITLQGDGSLYPLYTTANVQLYLQLTYGAGYYPLYNVPLSITGNSIVVDASVELASICASFPLASRQMQIDSVELFTINGYSDWFVHVYTSALTYTCN